jgi:hypothetical protein
MPPVENGGSPKLNLPPPVIEAGSGSVSVIENSSPERSTGVGGPEAIATSSAPLVSNPIVQSTDFPVQSVIQSPVSSVAASTASITVPAMADDNDLIEKEWIVKAKQIVDNNREDPYNQSKEMTVFKADYIKKRYNKSIKISE